MPLQDDYQVSLDAFHGPLDLLLYLIRRAEVNVHDIPIARITDQYLAFLKQIDHIDIDLAGEFLVMAATLIEIKSRTLMPASAGAAAEEKGQGRDDADDAFIDPRSELIQQLLEYQRYRIAAESLDHRREEFALRFPIQAGSASPGVDAEPLHELELEDAHVLDLLEAYERIMASIDLTHVGDHRVEMDDTPILLHQEDLLDRLRRAEAGRITIQEAFEGRNRTQIIGLFLGMLELVRQRHVLVRQDSSLGTIVLELNDDPAPTDIVFPPQDESAEAIHDPSRVVTASPVLTMDDDEVEEDDEDQD